jgi:EF hand
MTMKSSLPLLVPAIIALALSAAVVALRADDSTSEKPLSKAQAKYDADKDGKLSDEEKARMKEDAKEKREERMEKILEKYDVNKNGKLDPEEKAKWEADKKAAREARKAEREKRKAEHDARQAELAAQKSDRDASPDPQK